MARLIPTLAGDVHVLPREAAFAELARRLDAQVAARPASVGLSGGSTPKAFYAWARARGALGFETLARTEWHVSDERCVPAWSEDSNFGQAARGLLDPLRVPALRRFPWPTELSPRVAAEAYDDAWTRRAGRRAFDLCVLGLGDDAHVASLWPGCPLIGAAAAPRFAATEWPGRGWRLTITETGLAQCGAIVALVNGRAKAAALRAVCEGDLDPVRFPGQVLRAWSAKVVWLVDEEAAAEL